MENKQTEKSQAELYREERKERMAKTAKKTAKKSPQAAKAGKIVGKVVSIVVAVALCLLVVYGCLSFFGVPQMVLTATKVGNEKVSVAKYNYYYMDIYLQQYNQSYQYDSNYGSGYGVMYTGYDYTKTPMEQSYTLGTLDGFDSTSTPTWADYFRINALNYVQSYIAYSALAREAGITLTDEQKADIEDNITSITDTAKQNDYSLNRYLIKLYGKGVNEKLIREILEERYLAYNYASQKQQEYTDAVTEEQILNEFETNKTNYTTFSASLFAVDAASTNLSSDATDEEVAAAEAANMQTAKATADGLFAKVTTPASVLGIAQGYNSNLKDTSVNLTDATYSTLTSSYGQAVADWVYASDRAVGDKACIEVDGGYVIISLSSLPARDTSKAVNVRHILVQFPSSTDSSGNAVTLSASEKQTYYDKAQSIYNEYLANPTEDNFATLAETYSEDTGSNTNGGLYEDVAEGDMVTQFNDWIFDASRKAGDTGIIETTYGYHIMYYVNNNNGEAWHEACKTAIATTNFQNFDTEIIDGETYKINKNASIIDWSANELEKTITKQYVNMNSKKSTSSSSSSAVVG